MTIKKTELYNSLWASCDELRGDKINKLIGMLAEANELKGVIDVANFQKYY